MVPRKIIAASISGTLFAVLLGFMMPNPFGEQVVTEQNYFHSASTIINIYLMYSFPVILLYGVLTSIISDKTAVMLSTKIGNKRIESVVSGILHLLFGLILLPLSFIAAVLFFIIDRLLQKKDSTFDWVKGGLSLFIPLTAWVVSISIVWVNHFMSIS